MSLGRFSLVSLTLSFAVLIRAAVLLGGLFIYFPSLLGSPGFRAFISRRVMYIKGQ